MKMDKSIHKVLIIDDEESIRDMIRLTLERDGYQVLDCETTKEARKLISEEKPSIILLDWMLPNESGIELATKLKQNNDSDTIPIIMITAKTEEEDKLAGFSVGIDDYITKPFSVKEMLARIESVLRRTYKPEQSNNKVTLSGITVDKDVHLIYTNDKETIHLGPTEFKLIYFLITHPNRVYSRSQLLDYVWGENIYVEERTVDVHIRRLRRALEPYQLAHIIRTVRGSGYSFIKT